MAELDKAQRLVINQLLDHAVFTSSVSTSMSELEIRARRVYQSPLGQQRINGWFARSFGFVPQSYRDNWLWLAGPNRLSVTEVRILLATLKAVINTPAAQGVEADRVIATQPIVTAVRSVVPELGDRQINKVIHQLFVDRFGLLIPDTPEVNDEENSTVDEYWDVATDFVPIAQLLVQSMQQSLKADVPAITPIQRVNAYLLKFRSMTPKLGALWQTLQENKQAIADLWVPLQRFYLEVGDDYALLLDANRRQLKSRQYFVAIAVARSLGAGVANGDLGRRIAQLSEQLYPNESVNPSFVREELRNNALAYQDNDYWVATAVASRFAITLEDKTNGE